MGNVRTPLPALAILPLAVVLLFACGILGCGRLTCAEAATAPSRPTLTRPVVVGKTSIRVSWKKAKRADGYRVYLIGDDGFLKRIGSVRGRGRTAFVAKGLRWKSSYTFTVRAYRKHGRKTSLSSYDSKGRTLELSYKARFRNGCKLYYDARGKLIKDVTGIVGKRRRYLLKVNTRRCAVTAYVYGRRGKKRYRIPLKSWLCSPSAYTASGTWHARGKHRFWTLYYSSYSQWTMTIHNPILFHTVPYRHYGSKTSLNVAAYNKLGTPASHGCVRMPCDGMKWIYDNCRNGTKVVIYRSGKAGPFGKPKLQKIPKWHTWDPTDPTCRKLCEKHGCH